MRQLLAQLLGLRRKPVAMELRNRMSDKEVTAGFASAPTHPLYRSVTELLDETIMAYTDLAMNPKLPDNETKYYLGGADALLAFKAECQKRIAASRKADHERTAA